MIKIRARVDIGSLTAGTPPLGLSNHILSFNVDKARGRISTFSASLKVRAEQVSGSISGSDIKIYAGTSSSMPLIYTGIVRTANIGPCREDPEFVILNISGEDVLARLNGKKFTRRCRSSKGLWVGIESVVRPGLRSSQFQYVPGEPWINTIGTDIDTIGPPTQTRSISSPEQTSESPPGSPNRDQGVAISGRPVAPEDEE